MNEHRRTIEYMRVADLEPATRNPKRHDVPTIKASMDRFGYTTPAEVDERTLRLVSGHGRVETLLDAEAAELEAPEGIEVRDDGWYMPVLRGWASRDDAEAEAYIIAANRIPEAGGWDMLDLTAILADVDDLTGVGFSDIDVADIMALHGDAPALSHVPRRASPGDLDLVAVTFHVPKTLARRSDEVLTGRGDDIARLTFLLDAATSNGHTG